MRHTNLVLVVLELLCVEGGVEDITDGFVKGNVAWVVVEVGNSAFLGVRAHGRTVKRQSVPHTEQMSSWM